MADAALTASLRLKANDGLAARVIKVVMVSAFIGDTSLSQDGRENEPLDWGVREMLQLGLFIRRVARRRFSP